MNKLLLYGGRFDPIHQGHLLCARAAMETLGFPEVVFIPSGTPPHKPAKASFEHRLKMVMLAIDGEPGFDFSPIEGESQHSESRKGISYTIDTVKVFAKYGYDEIYWLIGSDNVSQIPNWKNYEELKQLAKFVVINRPGGISEEDSSKEHNIVVPAVAHSSTEIRERVRDKRSIRFLTPDSVVNYIKLHNLYKD